MTLPWMRSLEQRGPIVGSTDSPSKKKQHNDVVYPIFLKCAEMEEDSDWKELFINLAHDRMPKGCNVRNKTLAYTDNYKTTPVRMDLEPAALREQLISLFSSKKGLLRLDTEVVIPPTVLPSTWKDVKKKAEKRIYILEYVAAEGDKLKWTQEQQDKAYMQVSVWLELGSIRQNEVSMEKGVVTGISDLQITKDGVHLLIQHEKKCKDSIQVVHLTRLYQRLHRSAKKKANTTEVEAEQSESTAS